MGSSAGRPLEPLIAETLPFFATTHEFRQLLQVTSGATLGP